MKFSYILLSTVLASDGPVVTAEDRVLASEVTAKKDEMCAKVLEAGSMDEAAKASVRTTLEGSAGVDASGLHPVESMLRNYDPANPPATVDPLELLGITYFDIIAIARGAVMAILLWIFWICCYHQLCCRCIPKKSKTLHETGCQKPVKGGYSVCTGILALAIMIVVLMAPRGELVAGSNRIACTLGEMADASMNGHPTGFPGFLGICQSIGDLLTGVLSPPVVLEAGPPVVYENPDDFVPAARQILLDTEDLDRALAVVLSSLDRLKKTAEAENNILIDPSECSGTPCSGHKNLLLEQMGPKLEEVRSGLDSTIAGVLSEVKTGAADFLSDENLQELFGTVNDGILAPLKAVKTSFITAMGEQLTSSGGIPALVELYLGYIEQACSVVGFFEFLFGVASLVCIGMLIKWAPLEGAEGKDRYPPANHRCACCTWFCGYTCTFFVCLVSTLISIVSWPYSSGCLVLLDLDRESMANYPVFESLTELDSAMGIMEACIFPGGDGDMLGAVMVPYNDTRTVPSGEDTRISAREMVSIQIKGAVDTIFAPLETMEMDQQEVEGMAELEQALALLQNVSSFYTYAHEVESNFPSLAAVVDALTSNAMDYDPRLEDQTCQDGTADCPALGARVRIASLACESLAVPNGTMEPGAPSQIEGMGFVFESINSYPRGDGGTTEVTCETVAGSDGQISVNSVTPPLCADDDPGMCAAMCEAEAVCVGLCTGAIATSSDPVAEATYQAAVTANPNIADGIDSSEKDTYCPPVATQRVLDYFIQMRMYSIYTCYDFDCANGQTLAECATFDEAEQKFKVPMSSRSCTLPELVRTFNDAGASLRDGITNVEDVGRGFVPAIATDLKGLIFAKMVDPFLEIIDRDKMNCGFLVDAWAGFMEGTCYNLGGAIAGYAYIFTMCAQCGFFLVFLNFGLWRHFLDMHEAANQEVVTVKNSED